MQCIMCGRYAVHYVTQHYAGAQVALCGALCAVGYESL